MNIVLGAVLILLGVLSAFPWSVWLIAHRSSGSVCRRTHIELSDNMRIPYWVLGASACVSTALIAYGVDWLTT